MLLLLVNIRGALLKYPISTIIANAITLIYGNCEFIDVGDGNGVKGPRVALVSSDKINNLNDVGRVIKEIK